MHSKIQRYTNSSSKRNRTTAPGYCPKKILRSFRNYRLLHFPQPPPLLVKKKINMNETRLISNKLMVNIYCTGEQWIPASLSAARFDPNSFRHLSQLLQTLGLSHYISNDDYIFFLNLTSSKVTIRHNSVHDSIILSSSQVNKLHPFQSNENWITLREPELI